MGAEGADLDGPRCSRPGPHPVPRSRRALLAAADKRDGLGLGRGGRQHTAAELDTAHQHAAHLAAAEPAHQLSSPNTKRPGPKFMQISGAKPLDETQYRRRTRKPPQVAESWQRDLRLQHGCCPLCREPLLFANHVPDSPSQWVSWYAGIRKAIGHHAVTLHTGRTTRRLIHAHCARRHLDDQPHNPAPTEADSPPGAA